MLNYFTLLVMNPARGKRVYVLCIAFLMDKRVFFQYSRCVEEIA